MTGQHNFGAQIHSKRKKKKNLGRNMADRCFAQCNYMDSKKESKKMKPTHIILFVKFIPVDNNMKKNREFEKLIPNSWMQKKIESGCIKTLEECKSTGMFSSSSMYKPKYLNEVRHYIYKKIGSTSIKQQVAELDKVVNFVKSNNYTKASGCSFYERKSFEFNFGFGFGMDVNEFGKKFRSDIKVEKNMFVRNCGVVVNGPGDIENDYSEVVPFQVQVKYYAEYEFYVIQKIGYVL